MSGRKFNWMALMCLWVSAPMVMAADKPRAENGVESTSENVLLPSNMDGRVTVRSCSACPSLTLQLTPNSQFFDGGKTLSLKQLRQLLVSSSQLGVLVAYYPQTNELTRVVVTGRLQ